MSRRTLMLSLAAIFVVTTVYGQTQFDCSLFSGRDIVDDGGLSLVKSFIEEHKQTSEAAFDLECINQAVKRNYYEATEVMIEEYFSKEPQRASRAESTARNAIEQVKNRQNDLLARFEHIPKSVPVISPAFQWAQSLNQTFLEVKFSTRFDSPACLDVFDTEFRIENEGTRLYLKAMCRNDKKLLKYEFTLDLFGQVLDQPESTLEESSVGRVFINLQKAEQPSRWKKLLANGAQKPGNMGVWWELWEKHQEDLNKEFPDEDDDDEPEDDENSKTQDLLRVLEEGKNDDSEGDLNVINMDDVGIEKGPKKKKGKGGKKGKKKAGKSKKDGEQQQQEEL